MFKSLIDVGFLAENIFLLGKCYSTNPYAVKILEDLGINVSGKSAFFNSHQSFDDQFNRNVNHYFSDLLKKAKGKIILLDDGAALLQLASKLSSENDFIAIEQTSAGYHRAKALNLSFPIINVARSDIKLDYESIFICRMISYKIAQVIIRYFNNKYSPKILILGAGKIGLGIYSFLKNNFSVDIFDINNEITDFPENELDRRLCSYDLVVGSTGNCSVPKEKHRFLKQGVILISTSSSDREFDSVEIRKKYPMYSKCHNSIVVDGINLINSGLPVNFDETYLDSYEFQLTRGLLISAINQALEMDKTQKSSFVKLDDVKEIVNLYLELFPDTTNEIKKSQHEMTF